MYKLTTILQLDEEIKKADPQILIKLFSIPVCFLFVIFLYLLLSFVQAAHGQCRRAIQSSSENPKKEPVLRTYTSSALIHEWKQKADAQKIVIQRDKIFFIDEEGWLFSKDRHNEETRHHNVFGLKILSVISYNQNLVVLQEGGVVSAFNKKTDQWIKIDDSVDKLISTGTHLFALVQNTLWIYGSYLDLNVGSSFSLHLEEGFSIQKIKLEENIQDIQLAKDGFNVMAVFNNDRPPALIKIEG